MILAHFGAKTHDFTLFFAQNFSRSAPTGNTMLQVPPTGDIMRKVAPTGDTNAKNGPKGHVLMILAHFWLISVILTVG